MLFPSVEKNKADEIIDNVNNDKQHNEKWYNKGWPKLPDFFESNLFLIVSNIVVFAVSGLIGFRTKRLHIKHAQFMQRFDKTKELFANIVAEIINHTEKELSQITENKIKTDAEMLILCSYLSERKSKKFIKLYRQYQKQADDKDIDAKTINDLLCFH